MKSLIALVLGLMVMSIGIGITGFQPAAIVWAGQAIEHDHAHGTGASAKSQEMMARMSALDDQIKTLDVEMNAARTADAKLTAVTRLLNVLVEQRSLMRMHMETQGKMMEQMMMSMHQMMQRMKTAPVEAAPTAPR